ncbi:unnamed protein product [Rotaria socialis]|uniref:DOMON domain-containing protein n=1 Tax=Rotaria socialis TaxID=392032 RepID=A0A817WXW0_9BILA|nr:unnamed protein product [Rotaria socialis]
MTQLSTILYLITLSIVIDHVRSISSPLQPFITYQHSVELEKDVADLWWTIDSAKREITFELHIKTIGWIALGISPAGGMIGADIGVGWVDQMGHLYFQDRYAFGRTRPMIDNTTIDWFGLQGRESSGWTAIQFKRLLDTCDVMDVEIKSGTNNLIFAYGLADPDPSGPNGEISYHDSRRGSRAIPLQSYADPPSEDVFAGLDFFEFRLNNYVVPPAETTYHCKIYKAPSQYSVKRHAIGHKTLIGAGNHDLVHHLLMYECDSTAVFDDNNLPDDECDKIYQKVGPCASNIATGWAVGGDYMIGFPEEAGYPVGGNFHIKYYMVQMHYDNPNLLSNRTDSSGIRFYLGNKLRQYDLGYLTFGTDSSAVALAIPPKAERFVVDGYCTANATQNFPEEGITVISTFPHTHLQGRTVWTKIIRNNTAVDYLFNAEAYDFNYQYENRLPDRVKLYRGDEFATRCIYNTMNKDVITLGGERTKDEMCLHMATYYPRMDNLYGCMTTNSPDAWLAKMNISSPFDYNQLQEWLQSLKWTPERVAEWQEFYNTVPRIAIYGAAPNLQFNPLPRIPEYKDLKPVICTRDQTTPGQSPATRTTASQGSTKPTTVAFNSAVRQNVLTFFPLISIVMKIIIS